MREERCLKHSANYLSRTQFDHRNMRIAVVGPESSGKTTLCEDLMLHYHCGMVGEVSREYLEELERPYEEHDLLEIARSIFELHGSAQHWVDIHEEAISFGQESFGPKPITPMIFDTDLLNMCIWSQEKYGRVDPEIEQMMATTPYKWRFLCRPDIPWEPDPLRENPHDRDRLFEIWERELKARDLPYTIIEGEREQRLRTATNMVDVLLQGHNEMN